MFQPTLGPSLPIPIHFLRSNSQFPGFYRWYLYIIYRWLQSISRYPHFSMNLAIPCLSRDFFAHLKLGSLSMDERINRINLQLFILLMVIVCYSYISYIPIFLGKKMHVIPICLRYTLILLVKWCWMMLNLDWIFVFLDRIPHEKW